MTWYGASAYARHYGKRLLTEAEWEYVASKHLIPGKQALGKKANNSQATNDKTSTGSQMYTHMMDMDTELNGGKDRSKTPARKEPGEIFKEWAVRNDTGQVSIYEDKSKENIFYPSLVVATYRYPGQPFTNFRYPWEAFSDVGFRCAVSPGNTH